MLTGRSNKYQDSLHTEVGFFCRLQKRQKNELVGAVIREKCTEYLFLLGTINSIQEGIVSNDMRRGGSTSTRKSPVPADRATQGLWHSTSAPGLCSPQPASTSLSWGRSQHWELAALVPRIQVRPQLGSTLQAEGVSSSLPQQCSGERMHR